jgi:hypothetical protein
VERLLADPRVDPAAAESAAILSAAERGHLAVVERLLADPRVDPAAVGNAAIRGAAACGHADVVERLLVERAVMLSLAPVSAAGIWKVAGLGTPAQLLAALGSRAWARRRAAVLLWELRRRERDGGEGEVEVWE